jgi:aspartate kinase
MRVYKFGGASIHNAERFRNTAKIIGAADDQPLLVVISAMGKTTNALELVAEAYFKGDGKTALEKFEVIKQQHLDMLRELIGDGQFEEGLKELQQIFTEVEWLLHDKPVRSYDYYYDQIVCCGELLSTLIVHRLLTFQNIPHEWIDVRDILRTDNNFRDASVDWRFTENTLDEKNIFGNTKLVITQGFIGCTDENESTTLGREGSDYSAAIFANLLSAESLTIWKDVASVMSADPKLFPDAKPLAQLSFNEVIEMAFYGAQVIHPKTIKPLHNKNIPLLVKCFLDPSLPGTAISSMASGSLPPIIVLKEQQVLMEFRTKDFSFVEEELVEELYRIFSQNRVKPNLTQNAAVSLLCCFDDRKEKTEILASEASKFFDVSINRGLTLLTVRHYDEQSIRNLISGRKILLEQRTPVTAQLVLTAVN